MRPPTPQPRAPIPDWLQTPARVGWVTYALALVVAMHWPGVRIEGPAPRTDLWLHLIAFAGWVVGLALTGWTGPVGGRRGLLIAGGIALVYAVVGELTQGLPGVNRVVAWEDAAANIAGVVLGLGALAGFFALRGRDRVSGASPPQRSRLPRGPWVWCAAGLVGLLLGAGVARIAPAEWTAAPAATAIPAETASAPPEERPVIHLWMCLPFAALLLSIALMPFVNERFWRHHFPDFAFLATGLVTGYYLVAFHGHGRGGLSFGAHAMLHTGVEYYAFIALVGGLYIASGGVLIRVRTPGAPLANTVLLAAGAVLANIVGTTGASVLLIRPFLRMNAGRLRPMHVVMFIFIVSNCGGALTPIGDPPLYLGYIKGVPFFWTLLHIWPIWLTTIGLLLAIFFVLDTLLSRFESSRDDSHLPVVHPETDGRRAPVEIRGGVGLLALTLIIAAVFLDPALARAGLATPLPVGPAVQILVALGAYALSGRAIRRENEFTLFPIKEVALLFVGIFATMTPALGYLAQNGARIGIDSVREFYFTTGALSGILDNAPTYINFLQLAVGPEELDRDSIAAMLGRPGGPAALAAISTAAVFFGAMTYIGNGPNFMVRAIAESSGLRMPSFLGYLVRAALVLLPVLIVVYLIFFRQGSPA